MEERESTFFQTTVTRVTQPTPLQRPSTAGPRMTRSSLSSLHFDNSKRTINSSSNSTSSTSPSSPGRNLIGRSLNSVDDVNDAKLAIRHAQMQMQKLRRQRAEMEKEEEDEQNIQKKEKQRNAQSKRNMARRLAGLPEEGEEEDSPSRKSDTEESRCIREVQESNNGTSQSRILFYNDNELVNSK
jgi:hypothetical protein